MGFWTGVAIGAAITFTLFVVWPAVRQVRKEARETAEAVAQLFSWRR